jgi:hypothetical protein
MYLKQNLLLLLNRMLPDITSNTWAKKHFYNFFYDRTKYTIYNLENSLEEKGAGTLVAAVVAAAAAGATARGAARRAVAKFVETVTA